MDKPAPDRGPWVLVADDDPVSCLLSQMQIETLGYRCHAVHSGAEALKLWRDASYGVLFTDLHMPDGNGYELISTIRREENAERPLPIFALTGSASEVELRQASEAGANGYVIKPATLRKLQAILDDWLPVNGSQP